MKPDFYNLNSPHSFQLVKSYFFVNEIFKELEEHHDILENFAVSLQQLYKWLQKEIEEVDIRHPTFFHDSKAYNRDRARFFCLYTDIKLIFRKSALCEDVLLGG